MQDIADILISYRTVYSHTNCDMRIMSAAHICENIHAEMKKKTFAKYDMQGPVYTNKMLQRKTT